MRTTLRFPRLNSYLLIVVLVWGLNFVAVKIALEQVTPLAAALTRSVLMTLALALVCWASKIPLRYPKGLAWRIHLQGALNMGFYMWLFMEGMGHASAAEGAIILGTGPLFTLLFAILAKQEKFRWSTLAGTLVAFSGVAIVVGFSPSASFGKTGFIGFAYLVAAAAVWALGTVVSRPIMQEVDSVLLTTLAMPAGTLVLMLAGGKAFAQTPWQTVTPMGWAMLGYLTLFAGTLGFLLFYKGVRQIGAPGAMLYQYLVSPTAALASWLILHQPLAAMQLVGLAVVLSGVGFASSARTKESKAAA